MAGEIIVILSDRELSLLQVMKNALSQRVQQSLYC